MPTDPPLFADLHIHSKYSRACSRDCDLENLAWWARRKGVSLVGTGDFTHPAWFEHLQEMLTPAEPGLYRLREDVDRDVLRRLPATCRQPVRFMLSVEISTIYKRDDRTRKVHHLVYLPDFDAVREFNRRLGRIGNLGSDGRPILGLDSRDLLEITLESSPDGFLVPAHIWTPWFAVLGSKSGFDVVADCYADLADHIFALETGLSADPEMCWRISDLHRYRLVSNSDAHSPPMLGREASAFDAGPGGGVPDYFAVREALRTGAGYRGSVEFFPEEGKYFLDGHRKCEVRLTPEETREHDGRCPDCGKPLTVGVLHRVEALADQPAGTLPDDAPEVRRLVPLPEVVGEILRVGPKSKTVLGEVAALVSRLGPELAILDQVPLEDIGRAGSAAITEAITRLRRGQVLRDPGYDGEYGTIRLFEPGELSRATQVAVLFDPPPAAPVAPVAATRSVESAGSNGARPSGQGQATLAAPAAATATHAGTPAGPGLLGGLDPDQRAAAEVVTGPLLIVAGPGTGKTRTLTHRVAHLVTDHGVPAERCLAITFTRRAADEMAERLAALIPEAAPQLTVTTFHGLGVRILREQHHRLGLRAGFGIADEAQRLTTLRAIAGSDREARRLVVALSRARREEDPDPDLAEVMSQYTKALRAQDLVDFDDLIALPVRLLSEDAEVHAHYRQIFGWVCVDEYQDVDELQYRLLRLLTPADGNLCAIGDPDQAIYAFRGADVGFFLRFQQDFPAARTVQLTRNYRSSPAIVSAAVQAIAPTSLVPGRRLHAVSTAASAAETAEVPETIGVYQADDESDEAAFIARGIDQLLGGQSFHSLDSDLVDGRTVAAAGIGLSDIAVLYRTDGQSRAIMAALTRAGLPFQKRSHDRLADRPGVQALLRDLRYRSTEPGAAARAGSVRDRLAEAARAAIGVLPAGDPDEQARQIRAAVDLLAPLADRCGTDTARFVSELCLGAEVDTWDPRADRITLLTLHAAKGLEFPVVFLAGCETGLLPLRVPGVEGELDEEHVREERRLFFVGVTRAQSYLYLSHARRRTRHGVSRSGGASPFIASIEAALLDRSGTVRARTRPRGSQLRLL